jgi:hypothetical protein
MGLPASGPISSSQVGVYVFNRTSTQEFSLSASFSPSTSQTKVYSTTLGPIWSGNNNAAGDINNSQVGVGPNNLTLASWYNYYKGEEISITGQEWETRVDACDDASEGAAYTTEYAYWGGTDGIIPNVSVTYTDPQGTNVLTNQPGYYYGVYKINGAAGKWSGQFNADGIFTNNERC